MVIFHSYVSLPEGIHVSTQSVQFNDEAGEFKPELFSIFPKVNQKMQESHNQWLDFSICLRHLNQRLPAQL